MLNIQSVNKSFNIGKRNEISVLKDISLSFPDSGLFIIVGPSGSGKSTLLSLLGALDKPDSGSIFYNGTDIVSLNEKEADNYRQNVVSFIFQENNLIEYLSLKENVSIKSNSNETKLNETLDKLNISQLSNKKPNSLSGGEKERCAITRAVLADSKIVLCDEPTASLDAKNAENVIAYLKDISEERLVIIVSHDEKLCSKYSDHIIHISDGKIVDGNLPTFEEKNETLVLTKNKIYRSKVFNRTFRHIKHNYKQSILLVFLSMIAFLCVSMIIGMSEGLQHMVNRSITDLIHASPLTVSSYYENFANIALISDNEVKYETGININEQNNIVSSLHKNIITDDFIEYITKDPYPNTYFSFNNDQSYSIIYEKNGMYQLFDNQSMDELSDYVNKFLGKQGTLSELPYDEPYFRTKFNWVAGSYPQKEDEAVLVFNKNKSVNDEIAEILNIKGGDDPLSVLNKTFYLSDHQGLYNVNDSRDVTGYFMKDNATLQAEGRDVRAINNYLIKLANDYYDGDVEGQKKCIQEIRSLFKSEQETKTLHAYTKMQNSTALKDLVQEGTHVNKVKIVGLAEIPETTNFTDKLNGILVSPTLLSKIRKTNSESEIAKEIDNHIVLLNNTDFIPNLYGYVNTTTDYFSMSVEEIVIAYLEFFENRKFFCTNNEISSIEIYADNVDIKNKYVEKIKQYNVDKDEIMEIKHLDLTKKLTTYFNSYFQIFKSILYTISIVTLVVSMILSLSIIFNIVTNRVKEIGVLRASGFSRRYVFALLEVESMVLGLLSGLLGVGIAHILIPIINHWLATHKTDMDLSHLLELGPLWTILIIVISVAVGLLATLLPSIIYSNKKPIEILKQ